MPLILDNSIFLHVPKTGGTWVRKALIRGKVHFIQAGGTHGRIDSVYDILTDDELSKKTIFMFVRHPLTWYQSRWAFRMQTGWDFDHELDANCWSNDFNTFVQNCYMKYPNGWYTNEFQKFYKVPKEFKIRVGKQENLTSDLVNILQDCDEYFDPDLLLSTKNANVTNIDNKSSNDIAIYSESTQNMVLEMDKWIIDNFYAN